ncbi:MAG: spore germination protein GerW family protein [Eubacteriales bacterium]|jgi:uncharacterized spore protein YtfJ
MADNSFNNNISALYKGLESFLSTKSVVGQPVKVGDSTLIPLADVSFGMGAGAFAGDSKDNGGGGVGAKMSPAAVLVIAKDGTTKLISLNNEDAIAKLIDMAPDVITKIKGAVGGTSDDESSEFAE